MNNINNMNSIVLIEKKAYAKINLYLKILNKRSSDNYHEMFTIMHMIDMFDTVYVNIVKDRYMALPQINIFCNDKSVPTDERNTVYKAVRLYFEYASEFINLAEFKASAVNVKIDKRIPSQAGLGGGSSNAASVLLALNEYFGNALSEDILLKIATKIGADVAFFVKCKEEERSTALCEGIGEIVTPLYTKTNLRNFRIDIIKPDCNISTKEAFEKFDSIKSDISDFNRNHVINIFQNGDIKDIADIMHNDFEKIIIPLNINEDIKKSKLTLMARGAITAQLSGSGSAVFGIFNTHQEPVIN